MKRYFFGGLIVGAAGLYFGWTALCNSIFGFSGSNCSDFTTEQLYKSPDGKHTAYRFIESGGGAAGWCYLCVGIDGTDTEDHEVFRIVPAQTDLDIQWLDAGTLAITYEVDEYTSTWRNQLQSPDDVTVLFDPTDYSHR